jgi:starch phosphorylase
MHFRGHRPNKFDLPERIHRLSDLAYNLWWTWEKGAQRLFMRIDAHLWEETYHNPVKFLRQVARARLNDVSTDKYYLEEFDATMAAFDVYRAAEDSWFTRGYPQAKEERIAYFSMEFGLHETLPIYSGGLGVLSGDHIKEASDLNLPFIGITFLYTHGYFTQRITEDGWQEAEQVNLSFDELPVMPVLDEDEQPLTVTVELPGRDVSVRLWEIRVGRVPLYLLDSNVASNTESDRQLTARLYSSDLDLRISQELLLGIGGVRAMRALGFAPTIWHMNEGHSAFMVLERIREQVEAGMSFEDARDTVTRGNIFTTHTPVPAGNDEFPLWLIDKYFSNLWPQLNLTREDFLDIALREMPWGETFSMPVLAFKMSRYSNGVSELHGQVARSMWNFLWPEKKEEDVPISHITNGIHTGSWLARRMRNLFNQYFPEDWWQRVDDPDVWEHVNDIPDEELWLVRRHLKRKMVSYFKDRARRQWLTDSVHPVQVVAAGTLLDPYALTLGFARRFATYKRASLVFSDLERILRLINEPNRPVQIIFAGKAHPADEPGKLLIQEIYRKVKMSESGGRLVFIEDYDINVGRYLVQGVDVWLNTPRRPNEASGTSGQKAALNGVPNFSILDGWWREGYNGKNGWAIGDDSEAEDPQQQDEQDAESLYRTLENEIIPLYYDNRYGDMDISHDWLKVVKESIRTNAWRYSMTRMVKEYATALYIPTAEANGKK